MTNKTKYTDWKISTKRLSTCSCDYGCPCEFNGKPTFDQCEGIEAFEITEGYFGDVRLDGLRVAGAFNWPGPVHEGKGTYLPVIDHRATEAQIEALFTILSGEEQEPTTMFNIYGSTIETELDPIFAEIDFEFDLAGRRGRMEVKNVLKGSIEPIRNPVTGAEHRAQIRLPEGFEFRDAEMGSATYEANGALPMAHAKRYAALTFVTYGPYGIIDEESYPLEAA